MTTPYLEITYRRGRAVGAYYYLRHARRSKVVRTQRVEPGLIVDFSAKGTPLGIEITAPAQLTMAAMNRVLKQLGCAPLRRAEFAPLKAA